MGESFLSERVVAASCLGSNVHARPIGSPVSMLHIGWGPPCCTTILINPSDHKVPRGPFSTERVVVT